MKVPSKEYHEPFLFLLRIIVETAYIWLFPYFSYFYVEYKNVFKANILDLTVDKYNNNI